MTKSKKFLQYFAYANSIQASGTCNLGSDINYTESGLVNQIAALLYGNAGVEKTSEVLNARVTIPAGEQIILSGYQTMKTVIVRVGQSSTQAVVSGDISVTTKDRCHTGGSSN